MTEEANQPQVPKTKSSLAASAFGATGIGLMVGAVLGLSVSPVVASFVGAVGAVLAALLGLNDRHFSTAKGVRIGCFGLAVLVAAPTGIYVRDHKILAPILPQPQTKEHPTLEEKKSQYEKLGFDEEEVMGFLAAEIMAPLKQGGSGGKRVEPDTKAPDQPSGGLHATETTADACSDLKDNQMNARSGDQVYSAFKAIIKVNSGDAAKWEPYLGEIVGLSQDQNANFSYADVKQALFIARDSACGHGDFKGKAILPSEQECQVSGGENKGFAGWDSEWSIVNSRIEALSETSRSRVLAALSDFLCR